MNISSTAIDLLGGPTEAAKRLSSYFPDRRALTTAAVWNWRSRGVPAEYCIPIERELAGKVSRCELRPDIYPPDEYKTVAH